MKRYLILVNEISSCLTDVLAISCLFSADTSHYKVRWSFPASTDVYTTCEKYCSDCCRTLQDYLSVYLLKLAYWHSQYVHFFTSIGVGYIYIFIDFLIFYTICFLFSSIMTLVWSKNDLVLEEHSSFGDLVSLSSSSYSSSKCCYVSPPWTFTIYIVLVLLLSSFEQQ